MNKILIEVSVPFIEKKYDVFVPVNKKVRRVIIQLCEAINELTNGSYIIKNNAILCDKVTGGMYNPDVLIKESGLKNGTKVLLI